MNEPVLIATDGASGLIRGVEGVFPQSLRQRGLAHKRRTLDAKVPEERWREVKAYALAAYQALSPLAARAAAEEFRRRYARELPGAVACFEDDFEACIAHLRLPIAHRKVIRTTNLLERLFGEERAAAMSLEQHVDSGLLHRFTAENLGRDAFELSAIALVERRPASW